MEAKRSVDRVISPDRTRLLVHKGIALPYFAPPDNIEAVQSFRFRADDILIVTSPKSGTHWATEIVGLILADGVSENVKRDTMKNLFEFALLTRDAFDENVPLTFFHHELDKMPSPRVMYSHLPLQFLPPGVREAKVKVIYVARNPKDVLSSLYRFLGLTPESAFMTWEMMFDSYIKDQLYFGPWDKHVLSYWRLRNEENFLFMKYEDMKRRIKDCVSRMADFIQHPISDDVLNNIVQKTSLNNLKKEMKRLEETLDDGFLFGKAYGTLSYYQKGVIGDWKNYFTVQQNEQFDKMLEEKLAGTGLTFEFE